MLDRNIGITEHDLRTCNTAVPGWAPYPTLTYGRAHAHLKSSLATSSFYSQHTEPTHTLSPFLSLSLSLCPPLSLPLAIALSLFAPLSLCPSPPLFLALSHTWFCHQSSTWKEHMKYTTVKTKETNSLSLIHNYTLTRAPTRTTYALSRAHSRCRHSTLAGRAGHGRSVTTPRLRPSRRAPPPLPT